MELCRRAIFRLHTWLNNFFPSRWVHYCTKACRPIFVWTHLCTCTHNLTINVRRLIKFIFDKLSKYLNIPLMIYNRRAGAKFIFWFLHKFEISIFVSNALFIWTPRNSWNTVKNTSWKMIWWWRIWKNILIGHLSRDQSPIFEPILV